MAVEIVAFPPLDAALGQKLHEVLQPAADLGPLVDLLDPHAEESGHGRGRAGERVSPVGARMYLKPPSGFWHFST